MQIALLIVAHAPYLRRAGRRPAGEEPLHELIAHSLIPLANLLSDLQATGLGPRVGLACSPLLVEQLLDPVVQKHFVLWMDEVLARRAAELRRFEEAADHHGAYLARFYLEWGRQALRSFEERYERNLARKLRELAAARVIEPLAGAASHAYLPLLSREESVRAQIEHGLLHTIRHLGRAEGLWLPGCGWRPGLERAAADVALRYVVADPSSLPAGAPAAPAWALPRRLAVVFGDEGLARHIWSPDLGYIGDPLYRDPSADGGYVAIGAGAPQPYDPYHALRRAQEHANHFVSLLVAESARRAHDDLLVVHLDAQLLGALWFEGPTWLQAVMTLCATHPSLTLTTPGDYLKAHRPSGQVRMGPGSWAEGGHAPWDGPPAAEYWQALHKAEAQMVALAAAHPGAEAELERVLNQAARELLLAQASEWPALLSAGEPEERAGRWRSYLARFEQLADMAASARLSASDRFMLEQLEEIDGPFPSLNYRIFAPEESSR
jgi:1,4-alpha-glucan branching enzyme